jgi:hypothetical protein
MYYEQARSFCEKTLNSSLATISSREEQRFLVDFIRKSGLADEDFWLGGEVIGTNGEFRWINHSIAVTYQSFHAFDHNFSVGEHLMLSSLAKGDWCSHSINRFFAICEKFLAPIPIVLLHKLPSTSETQFGFTNKINVIASTNQSDKMLVGTSSSELDNLIKQDNLEQQLNMSTDTNDNQFFFLIFMLVSLMLLVALVLYFVNKKYKCRRKFTF